MTCSFSFPPTRLLHILSRPPAPLSVLYQAASNLPARAGPLAESYLGGIASDTDEGTHETEHPLEEESEEEKYVGTIPYPSDSAEAVSARKELLRDHYRRLSEAGRRMTPTPFSSDTSTRERRRIHEPNLAVPIEGGVTFTTVPQ